MAAARAEVTNQDGKLVALANASALVLPGRRADLTDSLRLADSHRLANHTAPARRGGEQVPLWRAHHRLHSRTQPAQLLGIAAKGRPGTGDTFELMLPRGSNWSRDQAVRSTTVRETRISPGPASAAIGWLCPNSQTGSMIRNTYLVAVTTALISWPRRRSVGRRL